MRFAGGVAGRKQKHGWSACFKDAVESVKKQGRYRIFTELRRERLPYIVAAESGSKVISFCTNDYLGMSQHSATVDAANAVINECGVGAGGTRNIAGTHSQHVKLELELARLHGTEAALLYQSCYVANDAALSTMLSQVDDPLIISDEYNHASMIQGMLRSQADKKIFPHNDMHALEKILREADPSRPKLVAFETVNSMEGTIAPVSRIAELCAQYGALSFADEVHAVGLYGERGGGILDDGGRRNCPKIDVISGTLAKAYGVVGGYICGSEALIDMLRCVSPGFIFTTSLPPALAAAALASIRHLMGSDEERSKMHAKAAMLQRLLVERGLPLMSNSSHITPVKVGDSKRCTEVSKLLLKEYGMYVQPINYPTVPVGTERLRITVTPAHTEEMIADLADALREIYVGLNIPLDGRM